MLCKNRNMPHPSGETSKLWRGDDISYFTLHNWLFNNLEKKGICEFCGMKKKTQWASKTGKYKRSAVEDWLELCSSCHQTFDRAVPKYPKYH